MRTDFELMMKEVSNKNYDRLDVMHHLLAGFKSIFTDGINQGCEACRKACGGAGYASMASFTEFAA